MKRKNTDKTDGRCTTCPRWDRWHIRIPNPKDQQKLIEIYRKSGAKTKSDFVRARLLGEAFKVITENPSKKPYLERLSEIVALTHKIGVQYNEAVKTLNSPKNDTPARNLLRRYHKITSTSDTTDDGVCGKGNYQVITVSTIACCSLAVRRR